MNTLVPLMLYLALDCVQLALVQKQTVQVDSNFDDFTKIHLKENEMLFHIKKKKYATKRIYFITTMNLVHLKFSLKVVQGLERAP